MCCRAATRCWCWKAAASRSAGARPRACSAPRSRSCPATSAAPCKPEAVEARLKADRKGEIKALLVAQIDTASGVVNDIEAIGQAVRAAGHDALLMVDAVASLGCVPFEMDAWGVDVAMAGSQKGLMTPPGLGFVAAGPRAKQAHKTADMRSPYWDWTLREGEQHYQKYAGTPPEHLLFALRAALDLIFAEGLDNVFHRHRLLAEATRRAVGTWAEGQSIGFNVSEPEERSDTVTAVVTRGGESAQPLVDYCREKCGVVLGRALGQSEGKGFRIAHMGHINAPMILGTLSVVEMALAASACRTARAASRRRSSFWRRACRRTPRRRTRSACSPWVDPDSRTCAVAYRLLARRSCARRVSRSRSLTSSSTRTIRLIASGGMPDFALISRSCSSISARAGLIAVDAAEQVGGNATVGTLRAVLVDDVEQHEFVARRRFARHVVIPSADVPAQADRRMAAATSRTRKARRVRRARIVTVMVYMGSGCAIRNPHVHHSCAITFSGVV